MKDIEIPMTLLFRVKDDVLLEDVRHAAEAQFEHGGIRESFDAAEDAPWNQGEPEADEASVRDVEPEEPGYDGYSFDLRVAVLTILYKHGAIVTVFAKEALAKATIIEWARGYWDRERVPGDVPVDDDEAVSAYFEHVEDESYTIATKRIEVES